MANSKWMWVGCLISVLGGGGALAADPPTTAEVLGKIHHANVKEIQMGKMAQNHAMSKDVADFGKMLVKDHSAADKQVAKLAKDEGVALAKYTQPADTHIADKYTGTAFDDAFAKEMLADHKKDIKDVTEARDATTDPKLKALLTDILPVLRKHQDTAQKLVDQSPKHST